MKALAIILVTLLGGAFLAVADTAKIAFERGDAVWVAKLDGSEPRKVADGQSPELSPDGRKLAFNTQQSVGQPAHRRIAVADLSTDKVTTFENVPSENCLQPRWSPDGWKLLFYLYVNNEVRIGVINADGSDFHYVEKPEPKDHGNWGAAWAADGKSFFCEDMEHLFRQGLDGKTMQKWAVAKLVPNGDMSGDTRLSVSADGKTLLMDIAMNEESDRKDWDGPLPAIWALDLATEKAMRLTPKSVFAWDCSWLNADSILFVSQMAGEKESSIYRMSVTGHGKDAKRLVKNARTPSTSR
jgi:TolB protein